MQINNQGRYTIDIGELGLQEIIDHIQGVDIKRLIR